MPPVIDLNNITIEQDALKCVPSTVASRLGILPLFIRKGVLHLAVQENIPLVSVHQIENLSGMQVQIELKLPIETVRRAINRNYISTVQVNTSEDHPLFFETIHRAIQIRASDIHIDPTSTGGTIRLRVDGHLRQDKKVSSELVAELVSAIKVRSDLDIGEKRTPQDGQIQAHIAGDDINLRVATIPTIYGERVTLRLLSNSSGGFLESLSQLSMSERHYEKMISTLDCPSGIILISGPTGSGKTTTLYACLRYLREQEGLHLLSIEDPVEIPLAGVTQIQIDATGQRLSFHHALRSALRHDPDVILLGEIRDQQTAEIAIKSALTGHLVMATVHANSSTGVITRMLDLQISPFLIASTLRLSIAQRLVRKICQHCIQWKLSDDTETKWMDWEKPDNIPIVCGCHFCEQIGYTGRVALYEMAGCTPELRDLILCGKDESALAASSFHDGNLSIKEDAQEKIKKGLTTVDEAYRAILI